MIMLFISIIPVFLSQASTPPLLEMYRTKQGVGEHFILSQAGTIETVYMSSNYFKPEVLEAGTYSRPRTPSLDKRLLAIVSSEPKLGNMRVVSAIHDWQIKINGKKISQFNPRYKEIFKLADKIMHESSWTKTDVTHYILSPQFKIIQIKNTPSAKKQTVATNTNLFETCDTFYKNSLICEYENTFVYTGISGQKR